jgi:hypothetical protein
LNSARLSATKTNLIICVYQIVIQADLTANPRARHLAFRDEGAFWQEVLTPGSRLRSEIVFVVIDGYHRWRACLQNAQEHIPVVFMRVQPSTVQQ